MDKDEINDARSKATYVAAVLTPLLQALHSAEEILSTAAGAEKYGAALLADVDNLKLQAGSLRIQIDDLQNKKNAAQQELAEAEYEAQMRAKVAQDAALRAAAEAERAAQERAERAAAAATAAETGFAADIAASQEAHDARMADLFTQEQAAKEQADAIAKQLADVQAQAQKFAARLTG